MSPSFVVIIVLLLLSVSVTDMLKQIKAHLQDSQKERDSFAVVKTRRRPIGSQERVIIWEEDE